MAAATALPGFVGEQEWIADGHTTRMIERLQFFGSRLPFDFEQSFTFKCQERPTSWSIRLAFRRVLTDGTVTCEVTVQRLDNAVVRMRTDFWMRPILPFPFSDLSTRNLRAQGMLPNHQGTIIIQFMPNEALVQLGNLPLQLEMFFRIRNCHGDLAALLSPDYQERYPPPTAFENMLVPDHPGDYDHLIGLDF